MKKILLLATLFLLTTASFAQDETLAGKMPSNLKIGGFGGPIFQLSGINGDFLGLTGGGGGVVFNDFFVGGFGMGGSVDNTVIGIDEDAENYALDIGYGGLWLGYSLYDSKLFHPYLAFRLGAGSVEYYEDDEASRPLEDHSIFIFEPEVGVEVNLTDWFKMAGTLSYRGVSDADGDNLLTNQSLSAFAFGLSLRFGFFGN